MTNEIYISIDIEADGPIPGEYSMLSLGAYVCNGPMKGNTFISNLERIENAKEHPDTMKWWATQPEAWAYLQRDKVTPFVAMSEFRQWVNDMRGNGKSVAVAYPAGFDFTFVYWYLMKFGDFSPFGFSCIDIKTYAMSLLKTDFRQTAKKRFPQRWFEGLDKHTHLAHEDAREQGKLFMNMLKYGNPNEPRNQTPNYNSDDIRP